MEVLTGRILFQKRQKGNTTRKRACCLRRKSVTLVGVSEGTRGASDASCELADL